MEDGLEIRIDELGKRIEEFEDRFPNFPVNSRHQEELARCKLRLSEGVQAFTHQDYAACKSNLDKTEFAICELSLIYEAMLTSYLKAVPEWKDMLEQTISHSKRNKSYAIVVDKLARELVIYKDGKVSGIFNVELGANWIGDKQQQGDKSTPEGFYKIIDKKSNGQTRYYKALLLVRHAPKATIEAALNTWQPDTLIQNPAFLSLSVEHGFQVIFVQDENKTFQDKWKKFTFYNRLRWEKTVKAVSLFIRIKKQEYHPIVTIKIPEDDLRAIYRALPQNAYLVMKI
jgi:hypothetical protein